MVVWFDSIHNPVLNFFFRYWTYTGDWLFVTIVVLVILLFNLRQGLILGLAMIVQGLVTAFLKQVLFSEVPRPRTYFDGLRVLDLIDGVKIQDFNSFPSGHTMTAFTLAAFLALMMQKNRISLLLFFGALLTGISRIYLGVHFLIDVLVGSLIGILIALVVYFSFERYINNERKVVIDQPDSDLRKMNLNTDDVTQDL